MKEPWELITGDFLIGGRGSKTNQRRGKRGKPNKKERLRSFVRATGGLSKNTFIKPKRGGP